MRLVMLKDKDFCSIVFSGAAAGGMFKVKPFDSEAFCIIKPPLFISSYPVREEAAAAVISNNVNELEEEVIGKVIAIVNGAVAVRGVKIDEIKVIIVEV